jgi:excisionase family DNA binding protein
MTEPARPRRRAIPENDDRLMTVEDLADYLGISVQSVYKQRYMGTGPPGYPVGKYVRFKRSQVDAWLESRRDKYGSIPPR